MRYSIFNLVRQAFRGHRDWAPAWRDAAPRPSYDIIVIGGGGHGLATAYYLAKVHGISRVAVLEKAWIGSGNAGRNTTIIRSNYLLPGNLPFYELSMRLWEGLERELNYNAMVSQRGVLNLLHSDSQRASCWMTARSRIFPEVAASSRRLPRMPPRLCSTWSTHDRSCGRTWMYK